MSDYIRNHHKVTVGDRVMYVYDEEKHRSKVRAEVARRGLGSYMNDTKWRELVAAIKTLPFLPAYHRKDVMDAEPEPGYFDADVWYLGDWTAEGIQPFYSIEWIRIRPIFLKYVARLLPRTVISCEAELEQALQSLGQAYEKADDSIWIYGYR